MRSIAKRFHIKFTRRDLHARPYQCGAARQTDKQILREREREKGWGREMNRVRTIVENQVFIALLSMLKNYFNQSRKYENQFKQPFSALSSICSTIIILISVCFFSTIFVSSLRSFSANNWWNLVGQKLSLVSQNLFNINWLQNWPRTFSFFFSESLSVACVRNIFFFFISLKVPISHTLTRTECSHLGVILVSFWYGNINWFSSVNRI